MTTLAITSKLEMITETSRLNVLNLYKSFDYETVNIKSPLLISATSSITLNVSDSQFIILILDEFGIENQVLSLELTDGTDSVTMTNLGFFISGIDNITQIIITNTSDTDVNAYLVY